MKSLIPVMIPQQEHAKITAAALIQVGIGPKKCTVFAYNL